MPYTGVGYTNGKKKTVKKKKKKKAKK